MTQEEKYIKKLNKVTIHTMLAYADLYIKRLITNYRILIDSFKQKKSIKEDINEYCGLVFVKHWNNHYRGLYEPNKKYKHGDVIKYIIGDGPYYVFFNGRFREAQIIYDGGYMI